MISPDFEKLIHTSLNDCLAAAMVERFPDHTFKVSRSYEEPQDKVEKVIVLTISSHLFRIVVFLGFTRSETLNNLIIPMTDKKATKLEDSKFYDYLNEVGNVFCGGLKRSLQKAVASLGMSTPSVLFSDSLKFMKTLNVESDGFYEVTTDNQSVFYCGYYLNAYGTLDFELSFQAEEVDSGELELF